MSSEPIEPAADAPRRLTPFEIIVHGLADGLCGYVLLKSLWQLIAREHSEISGDLMTGAICLLVLALSLVIFLHRSRPESRGLRLLERGLSGLFVAGGAAVAVVCLLVMVSGARYKGDSPDAGGMAVIAGLFVFYEAAALLVVPFAMNASRLPARFRRLGCFAVPALAVLPFCLLVVVRLLVR
jgi:hypothetical protein